MPSINNLWRVVAERSKSPGPSSGVVSSRVSGFRFQVSGFRFISIPFVHVQYKGQIIIELNNSMWRSQTGSLGLYKVWALQKAMFDMWFIN